MNQTIPFDPAQLALPGYTPRARDASALLALLASAGEDEVKRLERALGRIPDAARSQAQAQFPASERPFRGRLAHLFSLLLTDPAARRDFFIPLLADKDLKTASVATAALATLEGDDLAEKALLAKLATARPEQRAGLARALAKVGGRASRDAVTALKKETGGDAKQKELTRLLGEAELILARRASRQNAVARIDPAAVPLAPLDLRLSCRRGLEPLLLDELKEVLGVTGSKMISGTVQVEWRQPLASLLRVRIWEKLAIAQPLKLKASLEDAAQAIASPAFINGLTALTEGEVRFRLALAGAGDGARWDLIRRLAEIAPALTNDPTEAAWEIEVDQRRGRLTAVPKKLGDSRFAYRREMLPASSHPQLAAALARLAGAPPAGVSEVVWDPFAGTGTELIECARLRSAAKLYGTDTDPHAIRAAKANAEGSGLEQNLFCLETADARTYDGWKIGGQALSLIITNPPLGRRVPVPDLADLMAGLVKKAAAELVPGGRFVWVSPLADLTVAAAAAAGLSVVLRQRLDLGGFHAEIQKFVKI